MRVAAVDIGATSGRVVVADQRDGAPVLTEVARFANHPRQGPDGWTWDVRGLHDAMCVGLARAADAGARSWGIDTWAIDYGVVRDGSLVGPVRAYRDPRHADGMTRVDCVLPWAELYGITGIQRLPFTTVFQLAAEDPQRLVDGAVLQLVPDLLSYWTTGVLATDVTNASTTGMVDPRTRQWAPQVIDALGLPASAFLPLDEPGNVRGEARVPGLQGLPLVGVATHDTASAFAGTPLADRDRVLVLSLGTWALVGAEVVGAVPSDAARAIDVTHELGVDDTVRVLRNVSGMWLLEECRRAWARDDGEPPDVATLIAAAADAAAFAAVFDVDAPHLAAPGQSAETIGQHLVGHWDGSRGAVVRVILESLVVRLAERAAQIDALLGGGRDTLHVVGGASRMDLLMQWLADATGHRVVAGPVEATALGNAAVQWITHGAVTGLADARALIADMPEVRTFEPRGRQSVWDDHAARLKGSAP